MALGATGQGPKLLVVVSPRQVVHASILLLQGPPSGRQEWGQRAAEVRRYHLAMNQAGVHINDKPGLEDADVLPQATHRCSPVMRDES